jgi:hypothetical protein
LGRHWGRTATEITQERSMANEGAEWSARLRLGATGSSMVIGIQLY